MRMASTPIVISWINERRPDIIEKWTDKGYFKEQGIITSTPTMELNSTFSGFSTYISTLNRKRSSVPITVTAEYHSGYRSMAKDYVRSMGWNRIYG